MKKADLIVGEEYWHQPGKYDRVHDKVVVTNLHPTPPKRGGFYGAPSGDKTLVEVDFILVSREDGSEHKDRRIVRAFTIKGPWQLMKEAYDVAEAKRSEEQLKRMKESAAAKLHYENVYLPKFELLSKLIEDQCGTELSVPLFGPMRVGMQIPEEIVDLLIEAMKKNSPYAH